MDNYPNERFLNCQLDKLNGDLMGHAIAERKTERKTPSEKTPGYFQQVVAPLIHGIQRKIAARRTAERDAIEIEGLGAEQLALQYIRADNWNGVNRLLGHKKANIRLGTLTGILKAINDGAKPLPLIEPLKQKLYDKDEIVRITAGTGLRDIALRQPERQAEISTIFREFAGSREWAEMQKGPGRWVAFEQMVEEFCRGDLIFGFQ